MKKKQINELVNDILNEEFTQPANGAFTGKVQGQHWAHQSPKGRGMTGSPASLNTIDIAKESEEFAKEAKNNKPYPLDVIADYMVEAFINLGNAEVQLTNCIEQNVMVINSPEKRATATDCRDKLENMKNALKIISIDMDKLTVSS